MRSMDRLYAILDVGDRVSADDAPKAMRALLDGGARTIQLRAKQLPARRLLELARGLCQDAHGRGALFIVNDRPDVALLCGADGVHLGQDDLPAPLVRPWLPAEMMIGVSCHSIADVETALLEGAASYLGFGPVFLTRSKESPDPVVGLDGLAQACRRAAQVPVVAIGGIQRDNIAAVLAAGAHGAAMISALLDGPIVERTREIADLIERGPR
jgi:thiamine-phosphate pyrophosphorylase